jgi:F-type H+-transporting ATPase subunit delta
VTSRGAAIRYARALFDTALAEKIDPAEIYRDLRDFAALAAGHDTLGRILTNPAIPASRKRAVVEQLIARAGSLQPPVAKLLLLLAERDRLALLSAVAQSYERRLMDHQKIVQAELVTAVSLPEDRMRALQTGLARATGREVRLAARIDPSIIGGAVARIGSTVYDGSVTRQLERMRETLAGGAEQAS